MGTYQTPAFPVVPIVGGLACAGLAVFQAIVVPETIDAIRAFCGIEPDAAASIARTNAALGIGRLSAARVGEPVVTR